MAIPYPKLAEAIYNILTSGNYKVEMYDENGTRVYQKQQARKFYTNPDGHMVTLHPNTDEGQPAMKVALSPSVDIREFENTVGKRLREVARQIGDNMSYDIRTYGKQLTPRDFAHQTVSEEVGMKKVQEASRLTGSTRSSYQKVGECRLIIRHKGTVNEEKTGARSRNISAIFVETQEGERFRMPNNSLHGARAMARHLSNGGQTHDTIGTKIKGMMEEIVQLRDMVREAHRINKRSALVEQSSALLEQIRGRYKNIRETLQKMTGKVGYMKYAGQLAEATEADVRLIDEFDQIMEYSPDEVESGKERAPMSFNVIRNADPLTKLMLIAAEITSPIPTGQEPFDTMRAAIKTKFDDQRYNLISRAADRFESGDDFYFQAEPDADPRRPVSAEKLAMQGMIDYINKTGILDSDMDHGVLDSVPVKISEPVEWEKLKGKDIPDDDYDPKSDPRVMRDSVGESEISEAYIKKMQDVYAVLADLRKQAAGLERENPFAGKVRNDLWDVMQWLEAREREGKISEGGAKWGAEKSSAMHDRMINQMDRKANRDGIKGREPEEVEDKYSQMAKKYGVKEASKPDFLDMDGDGDKKETMKKAIRDKKKKVNEAEAEGKMSTENDDVDYKQDVTEFDRPTGGKKAHTTNHVSTDLARDGSENMHSVNEQKKLPEFRILESWFEQMGRVEFMAEQELALNEEELREQSITDTVHLLNLAMQKDNLEESLKGIDNPNFLKAIIGAVNEGSKLHSALVEYADSLLGSEQSQNDSDIEHLYSELESRVLERNVSFEKALDEVCAECDDPEAVKEKLRDMANQSGLHRNDPGSELADEVLSPNDAVRRDKMEINAAETYGQARFDEDGMDRLAKLAGLSQSEPAAPKATMPTRTSSVAEADGDFDESLHRVLNGDKDLYDVIRDENDPLNRVVTRMYDEIAAERGFHPDDDHDKIFDVMMDQLEAKYGNDHTGTHESIEEQNRFRKLAGLPPLTESYACGCPPSCRCGGSCGGKCGGVGCNCDCGDRTGNVNLDECGISNM